MSETSEEARRLIEAALDEANTREFVELVERAEGSTAAFTAAADAYCRADLFESAAALERYANAAPTVERGTLDLCAAGAAKIARLLIGHDSPCGHDTCSGEIRLEPGAASGYWARTAIELVNASADRQPGIVSDILAKVYRLADWDGLRHVATSLVDTYAQVSELR